MQKQLVDTLVCPTTQEVLESLYDDVSVETHTSYGKCLLCNKYFAKAAMDLPMDKDPWPIIYEGCYCKSCYEKPLTKEEQIAILNIQNKR